MNVNGILIALILGCLRGKREHCKMTAIPLIAEEDVRRPRRERESLVAEQNGISTA